MRGHGRGDKKSKDLNTIYTNFKAKGTLVNSSIETNQICLR